MTRSHYDSYDNLLCQVAGYKLVRMHAPSDTPRLYAVTAESKGGNVISEVSTAQGNVSAVDVEGPDLAAHPLFAEAKAFDAVLGPGDVLFIPKGWWHYVRAITPSLSLNCWF